MFHKYINDLKYKYIKQTKEIITYSSWLDKWKEENKSFAPYLDDNLYAFLGCKVIDILSHSDMVYLGLIKSDISKHPVQALHIKDKNLMSIKTKQSVISLPTKLPMICKPKEYTFNKLGGYLLNDEKFADQLFVEKKVYAFTSELSDNNKVYTMVNKLASTPFKIKPF